jgi:hypothetical protein
MQQMQYMSAHSPHDQRMPFPQHFSQQMNQLLQQNNMGGMSMQPPQQSVSNAAPTNSLQPSKKSD